MDSPRSPDSPPFQQGKEILSKFLRETIHRDDRRYLWTDAYAVETCLAIYRRSGEEEWLRKAINLMFVVHNVLGKHRSDRKAGTIECAAGVEREKGEWLSGDGQHPTARGLRIGKRLADRKVGERYIQDAEWDRDGQYYHYLTRWAQALIDLSRNGMLLRRQMDGKRAEESGTGLSPYTLVRYAGELMHGVHDDFVYPVSIGITENKELDKDSPKRMYWKMSCDLSHAVVPSMGHHDPLDGYITISAIIAATKKSICDVRENEMKEQKMQMEHLLTWLQKDRDDLLNIVKSIDDWATEDSLGLGGLLCDVYRLLSVLRDLTKSNRRRRIQKQNKNLSEEKAPTEEEMNYDNNEKDVQDATRELARTCVHILHDANLGLEQYMKEYPILRSSPAAYRLAFREFGICIGANAIRAIFQKQLLEGIDWTVVDAKRCPYIATKRDRKREGGDGDDGSKVCHQGPSQDHAQCKSLEKQIRRGVKDIESSGCIAAAYELLTFWSDPSHRLCGAWTGHADINNIMFAASLVNIYL